MDESTPHPALQQDQCQHLTSNSKTPESDATEMTADRSSNASAAFAMLMTSGDTATDIGTPRWTGGSTCTRRQTSNLAPAKIPRPPSMPDYLPRSAKEGLSSAGDSFSRSPIPSGAFLLACTSGELGSEGIRSTGGEGRGEGSGSGSGRTTGVGGFALEAPQRTWNRTASLQQASISMNGEELLRSLGFSGLGAEQDVVLDSIENASGSLTVDQG